MEDLEEVVEILAVEEDEDSSTSVNFYGAGFSRSNSLKREKSSKKISS